MNLGAHATAVALRLELPEIVENILRILPGTKNIAVVLGNSPLEKFWLVELRREFQPITNRVSFTWLNELPFEEMRRRAATLPPHSAILYGALVVDAAGVPHEQERTLDVLHAESNAPMFGAFDNQLGRGIVGGSLLALQDVSRETARVAVRILNGEPPGSIQTLPFGPGTPVYDWRELKRWGISESRLPPGSVVRFRPPSLWKQYHWYIMGALAIITVQAVLIVGLLIQRARRRRAEAELRESQQFMELATSAGELGLWVRDLAGGDFWANAPLRTLFDFGQKELLRFEDFFARIHPDERAGVTSLIDRTQQSGQPFEVEFRIILPDDGTEHWVAAKGRTIENPQGRGLRRMGAAIDITALKQAEEHTRLVVEAAPNAMIMVNQEGKITLANAAVETVFG